MDKIALSSARAYADALFKRNLISKDITNSIINPDFSVNSNWFGLLSNV